MPVADFKAAFGFGLCQGFVTPPGGEVPVILTPAFPAANGAQQGLTAGSVQPSLQKGYGLWVGVTGILWCQLAGIFQL